MILQALNGYYERLADDPENEMPTIGFSNQKAHFALLINREGKLLQAPYDIRVKEGKKMIPREISAPAVKRASGISSNFTWDNTGYVLGADNKGRPERALKTFEAFREFHHQLCDDTEDEGLQALLGFLDTWNPENVSAFDHWEDIAGQNIVFQLEGEHRFIHERPAVKKIWSHYQEQNASEISGRCLVSGKNDEPIARLHPPIKGVRGAQTSGASIVSFNRDAFTSYNKKQSFNAPVSEGAAFAYTTALNHLLSANSRQKLQIGDATTVFWSERDSPMEGFMGLLFDHTDNDNEKIRNFLEAARKGKYPEEFENNPDMRFFILGLSPNASRLSVRFWHVSTVKEICEKIAQHFSDLSIARQYDNDPEFPGMWQLLRETAVLQKPDNISPVLAGAFMRSILTGQEYPQSLLSAVIGRIRSDQRINYLRAAMIKACLARKYRNHNFEMEVAMGLDKDSENIAYRLGRLFAVLEKVQGDAIPGAKATIKDRYFGSASATPGAVFPQLLRLAQHHIQKAEYGHVSDKRIEEIVATITHFPAHLKIEDQGLFSLGYYHQRPELFKKSEKKKEK
ncbi:MAG: type I-C CRISPR-associated protein Cas8c/Csd1 [Desulfobacterales bacterium]|nr:MAG: type I-C CRISPR-associated protein Cas8c/Csd1 [Desulfobacterales bacterium]